MVQKKGRKKLFAAMAVIGALLLIVAVISVVRAMSENEPSVPTQTSSQDTPSVSDDSESNSTDKPTTTEPPVAEQPAIDPTTVASVAIEPMSISVSYVKGVGGFDYEVLRTGSGTKYVEFSSTKLAGTKCTNDEGQFASIIEKPSKDEATTLAKTTTVDGTEYGLSLADSTCTSNSELLKQYQDAFSGAFSLLKKL